ncbi:MAG: CPBP family intramembrane metalloprotease [Chloroflexi bacterium]|nr:MAG: CPBP family intramembrane metalloprotease [Chloroflexota bacterium]MBL1192756.1 CPBP family intramembrane metalloprotease [Chloroflexota bacterium]NOH10050.1 CPBP family intramembrane metalloprotease [Chloroflexota bacterium]
MKVKEMGKPMSIADENKQYSLAQILGIWVLGGTPMWILGWLVYPALAQGLPAAEAGMLRIKLLTMGLIWQFVLSMIILYREQGNVRLGTIRKRFWLNHPISPKTGETDKRLWWWLLPFVLAIFAYSTVASGPLTELWLRWFPFLAAPEGFDASTLFAPELLPQWQGAWGLFWWFLVLGVFNTVLGEEFLYRGVLLPKMRGVFGKWDWVANAVLFTLYHIHQPWSWLANLPYGLLLSFSGRYFRSNWFPIILHSGQTVFFLVIILGVVLGLA